MIKRKRELSTVRLKNKPDCVHTQRQWVAPQYETVYDRFGRPSTILVRAGYWTEVYVPAQYATQAVQVWVPGCYAPAPRCGPDIALRVGFRF